MHYTIYANNTWSQLHTNSLELTEELVKVNQCQDKEGQSDSIGGGMEYKKA